MALSPKRLSLLPIVAIAVCGVPRTARADPFTVVSAYASTLTGSPQCSNNASGASVTCTEGARYVSPRGGIVTSSATATASASYGVLHSSAEASLTCVGTLSVCGLAYADANSGFVDSFAITDAPSSGSMVFTFATDGTYSSTCTVSAGQCSSNGYTSGSPSAQIYLADSTSGLEGSYIIGLPAGPNTLAIADPFTSTDGITLLTPTIELVAQSDDCEFPSPGMCSMSADFSDTAVVTGILVLDANGNVDPNAIVTDASGTNYDALVTPEPASVWLLTPALVGLVGMCRYRALRQVAAAA